MIVCGGEDLPSYGTMYKYSPIGNITEMGGQAFSYDDPAHPHAVTQVGTAGYAYDANGNMTRRGSANQAITWNAENMPSTISGPNGTATFVYDGDGNRVVKSENGQTILYVNKYFEKNLTTGEETCYYYLGGRRIAYKKGDDLEYTHNDHLTGTSVTTDSSGNEVATVKYFPFGGTRFTSGELNTDKMFTGQRLDETGLYFYNARYYDKDIGRFISPDTIVPDWTNPQSFNRYSYCLNNPLRYVDPSGLFTEEELVEMGIDCDEQWAIIEYNLVYYNILKEAQMGDLITGEGFEGVFELSDEGNLILVRQENDEMYQLPAGVLPALIDNSSLLYHGRPDDSLDPKIHRLESWEMDHLGYRLIGPDRAPVVRDEYISRYDGHRSMEAWADAIGKVLGGMNSGGAGPEEAAFVLYAAGVTNPYIAVAGGFAWALSPDASKNISNFFSSRADKAEQSCPCSVEWAKK